MAVHVLVVFVHSEECLLLLDLICVKFFLFAKVNYPPAYK